MKAKITGIPAQDYENDKVANIGDLYKGITVMDDVDQDLINRLYEAPDGISSKEFNISEDLRAHQFFYYQEQRL
jgi:predicted ribonuclease YlaK